MEYNQTSTHCCKSITFCGLVLWICFWLAGCEGRTVQPLSVETVVAGERVKQSTMDAIVSATLSAPTATASATATSDIPTLTVTPAFTPTFTPEPTMTAVPFETSVPEKVEMVITPTVLPSVTQLSLASGCANGCEEHIPGCDIKGNINAEGVKIYHVPGGRYYNKTQIDPAQGERWFCTGAEAQAAGWRPSSQ
jgi:hypothetical protein